MAVLISAVNNEGMRDRGRDQGREGKAFTIVAGATINCFVTFACEMEWEWEGDGARARAQG